MNAILLLGIEVLHCDGEPILILAKNLVSRTESAESTKSARINLVDAVSILAQKGRVVRARVSSTETVFSDYGVLFEPNHKVLDPQY